MDTITTTRCKLCVDGDIDQTCVSTLGCCCSCVAARRVTSTEELAAHNEILEAAILDAMELLRDTTRRLGKLLGRQTLNNRELAIRLNR